MHHYLEHTRDPRAELAAARTALAPGGLLLIEVPDPERSWSRRVGPYWGPWLQPQHQHFVPIDNLCAELERQGFGVVSRERGAAHQPIDYSSFVGMVSQHLARPKPWSGSQRIGRSPCGASPAAPPPTSPTWCCRDPATARRVQHLPGARSPSRTSRGPTGRSR